MTTRKLCIFTICSNNYLPLARAFIDSARAFHPQADMFVCLADEQLSTGEVDEPDAELITIDTLPIPPFRSFAFRYDVMELNTAAKPFMFLYLMEKRGYEIVLYFDPDIQIYAPLDAALTPLQHGASLVLTPHILQPSEGAEEPNDLSFLKAGVYNLGFLGAYACDETRAILSWWSRRLLFNCVNSQPTGLFVDQKFMDLVPGFGSNVTILRAPELNVAYWNLTQRRLERQDGRWTVDGNPLVFFHFSGFDINESTRLSKYTSLFNQNLQQSVRELVDAYAERLLSLGHGRTSRSAYAYARFHSGTPIPEIVRRMFRERHPGWPSDPFATFEAHLHRPSPTIPQTSSTIVITNLLDYLWQTTAALQRNMNLAEEDGRQMLVDWFVKHAMREMQFDARLVEPVAQRFGQALPTAPTKDGRRRDSADLVLISHMAISFDAEETGRLIWSSLETTSRLIQSSIAVSRQSHPPSSDSVLARIDLSNLGPRPSDKTGHADYTIAVLTCDLADLPQTGWAAVERADELWAPSRFLQLQAARAFSKPTLYMPLAHRALRRSDRHRSDYALPSQRYLFIQVVDDSLSANRTNITGTVEAFTRAFPHHQPSRPALVICRRGRHQAPDMSERLRALAHKDEGVFVLEQELTQSDIYALISVCDAAISLHRVEGVGLFVANAMQLGRPVIATDYAATTDLVTPATGFPVDYRLIPTADCPSFPELQGFWAEPDLDHAAWLMRRLVANPGDVEPCVMQAHEHLARNHSLEYVSDRQLSRLREINFNA